MLKFGDGQLVSVKNMQHKNFETSQESVSIVLLRTYLAQDLLINLDSPSPFGALKSSALPKRSITRIFFFPDMPRLLSASIVDPKGGADVGVVLGCSLAAFIFGSVIALAATYYYQKHRRVRVPGSPHYISKPNSYVTVPLREPPKRSSSSASSNGSSGYKTSSSSPTKLFAKPPDYETATIKRNSHTAMNGHGVRTPLDEDNKFF